MPLALGIQLGACHTDDTVPAFAWCIWSIVLYNEGSDRGKCVLQALFFTYGGMEPSTASLVAEMLGFNPDLVMPQLHHELTAAEQADASRP